MLPHDCAVVTESGRLWVELLDEPSSEAPSPVPALELLEALWSVSLRVVVDPEEPELLAADVELPPLPRAATASQAATNVAIAPGRDAAAQDAQAPADGGRRALHERHRGRRTLDPPGDPVWFT